MDPDKDIGTSPTCTPRQIVQSCQAAVVAAAGTATTVGNNTGTAGAGLSLIGDTTSVDQAAALMADLAALREDIAGLTTTVNAILTALKATGLMASS